PQGFDRSPPAASPGETGRRVSFGMGLVIVKELVELHGGRVLAQNAGPERGATFTVELPRQPAPGIALVGEDASRGRLAAVRVLLVDCDVGLRESLIAVLD